MAQNSLEQLAELSTIVADTGDLDAIARFKPTDATTNPSLILAATAHEQSREWAQQALAELPGHLSGDDRIAAARERLTVRFGCEILKHAKRFVSTEVDPKASFDTEATIHTARRLIGLYEQAGVPRERVLIKIASTWEGIRAASVLESQGIRCNLTLLFSFAQAQLCASAGVTLVSPFVGRILDWHVANVGPVASGEEDPGVKSVRRIWRWYKQHGYQTWVMGASFRNIDQILALAGCDLLTIAPKLLHELEDCERPVSRALQLEGEAEHVPIPNHAEFLYQMNSDAMASDRLADGIRRFVADQDKLDVWLGSLG